MEQILEKVTQMAAGAPAFGNSVKFKSDDYVIFLDGTGDANVVTEEDKDADCTITINADDLQQLMSGELNPMMAFMGGKLKIEGDMSIGLKLGELFS